MTDETLLRLDKWLWYARFCKSRTLAAKLCASGRIHLDGAIVQKPHHQVRVGNVLTFPLGPHVRVIKILALGGRRGPATDGRPRTDARGHRRPRVRGDEHATERDQERGGNRETPPGRRRRITGVAGCGPLAPSVESQYRKPAPEAYQAAAGALEDLPDRAGQRRSGNEREDSGETQAVQEPEGW